MNIESVITLIIGIIVASVGIIIGLVEKASGARAMAKLAALESRVCNVENSCEDMKKFSDESRADRTKIHTDFADIRGDLKAILERLSGVGSKVDAMFKKIYKEDGT